MTHRRLSGDWVGCGRSEHPETWLRSWWQEKRANFCPSWAPPEWVHGPGSVSYQCSPCYLRLMPAVWEVPRGCSLTLKTEQRSMLMSQQKQQQHVS